MWIESLGQLSKQYLQVQSVFVHKETLFLFWNPLMNYLDIQSHNLDGREFCDLKFQFSCGSNNTG